MAQAIAYRSLSKNKGMQKRQPQELSFLVLFLIWPIWLSSKYTLVKLQFFI